MGFLQFCCSVILFPIAVTFYVTWWFFRFVDGFFSPIYAHLGINIFGMYGRPTDCCCGLLSRWLIRDHQTCIYFLHSQMIVLFRMCTMTSAKNVAYQSYLSRHYLSSEKKRSLILKPLQNKRSLMPLPTCRRFLSTDTRKYCVVSPRHKFTPSSQWVLGLRVNEWLSSNKTINFEFFGFQNKTIIC